jgi:hypothetical protein
MKRSWYKFRIKYSKQLDNGKTKKVSEEYLVDSVSFSDTESQAHKAATEVMGTRDFDVTHISREAVSEIIGKGDDEDGHWYKANVSIFTESDDSEEKKVSSQVIYVHAEDTKQADTLLREHMKDSMFEWAVKSIGETKVLQVFTYHSL